MEEKRKKSLGNIISFIDNDCEDLNEKKENISSIRTPKNIDKTPKNNEKAKDQEEEREIRIGNYLIKKTLGRGTFGKVKLGIYLPKNKKVAIKILEKKKLKEEVPDWNHQKK